MSQPEQSSVLDSTDRATGTRWRGAVFGLEIDSPVLLDGIRAKPGHGTASRRRATIEIVPPTEFEKAWRGGEAVEIIDRRHRDGRLMMAIDVHPELGYRVWAPRHGRHLVSHDGRRVLSALPNVARWRWQRLLFAQVLPLAATLQGIELFHASAVALNGRALAFIAASGTGKSSIAAHLVVEGASLVTDDVLALVPSSAGIVAHPGGGLVNVASEELESVPRDRRARIGVVIGRSDKVHMAANLADCPQQLRSIYFLRRGPEFAALRIAGGAHTDPLPLLSSGFISYVVTPERLARHLDVCSRIARCVAMFEVEVPATHPARDVAAAILAHAGRARDER